jgi:AcrR family transcriptional regulator
LPAEKRERVLNAAIDEFSQRNVEEANISNIVRGAGIPRGSLYQYFDGKDDLYVYVFETLREKRGQHVQPAYRYYRTHSFLTFFQHFYLLDTEFLLRHPSHIELGKVMYSHAKGVSFGLIQAVQRRYRDTFLIALSHDQDQGRVRAEVDVRAVADLCVHFTTDVFIFQNFMYRMSVSAVETHLKATIDVIRHGIE